jgi:hypothetical protein
MGADHPTVEIPSPLARIPGIRALFLARLPGIDTLCDRAAAMERLQPAHLSILGGYGLGTFPFVTSEQVHGKEVATVRGFSERPVPGADGLTTATRGLTLGIYVADCAPVWLVARDGRAGAMIHSGKKGTELGIVPEGIAALRERHGVPASDLIAVIGPCIRPPCYEVDFAAEIRRQATDAGIPEIHDAHICTACHPERYYSYRLEKGLTGRMLATLTLLP